MRVGGPLDYCPTMARLIKRYGNRKMYDTEASRYVTLDNVAALVRHGEDLRIVDNDTNEDLTAVTFAQIIFEEEKRKAGVLGLPLLRGIIQRGETALHEVITSVDRGREAVIELAEKGMKQLAQSVTPHEPAKKPHAPAPEAAPGRRLWTEILEMPQRQLEQIQQRIDTQVRSSIERVTGHPAVRGELRRIERSIKSLERQLSRLGRPEPEKPAARRPARKPPRSA